jgi:hypothetical protein
MSDLWPELLFVLVLVFVPVLVLELAVIFVLSIGC